jgi:hypothetical protein
MTMLMVLLQMPGSILKQGPQRISLLDLLEVTQLNMSLPVILLCAKPDCLGEGLACTFLGLMAAS